MIDNKLAWLALNHIPGAGAVTLRRLASRLGSAPAALEARPEELVALGSLTAEQAASLRRLAEDETHLAQMALELARQGVELLTLEDAAYPANLRPLPDAPPLLYMRGRLSASDEAAVAVVGTRSPSPAGADAAGEIARSLAARGIAVVSGLALGVDAAAHRGALAAGRTIAVLGSGIDVVTPQRHGQLAQRIVRSGALLSEIPPGSRACRETLLARNRIQAGLAKAVVIVQCREQGGSFATARAALQAGRPVLALADTGPGFAAGAQRLAAMGARVVSLPEVADLAASSAFSPLPRPCQMLLGSGRAVS